jgi:hypothetical protein
MRRPTRVTASEDPDAVDGAIIAAIVMVMGLMMAGVARLIGAW